MSRRKAAYNSSSEEPSIPMPRDENLERKYMVNVGRKAFTFDSEEEAKAFVQIIRKHITIEEAYAHVKKLREEGYFNDGEDDNEQRLP